MTARPKTSPNTQGHSDAMRQLTDPCPGTERSPGRWWRCEGRRYRWAVLLLSDPAVAEVPAEDCGEELVDLRQVPELLVDTRKQDAEGAWARLREGVLARLLQAQRSLPADVRLLIIEGYRPAALQQHYFDGYRADLAEAHPDWSPEPLDAEASKHVSPPAVAPRPCGAAVDLTLVRDGRELDMGTPVNATPEDSGNACFTAADNIGDAARG